MGVKIANILVGAGRLYVSPARARGEEAVDLPVFTDTENVEEEFDDDSDWRDVGATQDGLTLAYNPETGEVDIDQQKSPALVFNTGLEVSFSTNLVEATLENLALAWGLDDDEVIEAGNGTFSFGTPGDFYAERSIAVVGNAPAASNGDQQRRVYYARRVISAEGSEHTLSKTEAVTYNVTFRLLEDPEADKGEEYGQVIDVPLAEPEE